MMSSTISTSSSAMLADRSLRMRTRPGRFGRRAAVRADLHEVDPDRDVDGPHQVGHERQRALEDRDEGQLAAGVVGADARAELAHLGRDLLLVEQDLGDIGVEVHDVAHPGTAGPSVATSAAAARRRRRLVRPGAVPGSAVPASAVPIVAAGTAPPSGSYGAATWPDVPGQPLVQRELAVLEHQRPEVAGVEQLDVEVRVELAQPAQLAVLLADELLAQRGHLEVEVQVGQVEVGREALDHVTVQVPQDRERVWLVLPAHRIEVEDARHLGLAGVGERHAHRSTTDPRRSPRSMASSQPTRSPSQAARCSRSAATSASEIGRRPPVACDRSTDGPSASTSRTDGPPAGAASRRPRAALPQPGQASSRKATSSRRARIRMRAVGTVAPQAVHVAPSGSGRGRSRGPIGRQSSGATATAARDAPGRYP